MALISTIYGNNLYVRLAIKAAKKKAGKKSSVVKKKGLNQAQLCKFSKMVLGVGSRLNVSMWTLAYEALEARGIKNTENDTHKTFVSKNVEYIKNSISGNKKTDIAVNKFVYASGVASDEFLNSYEWRKLRLQALKIHGRKCLCCGATPETGSVMHVDHIKPRRHYPELALDINNLQVLCHECNHGKGNWDESDFRKLKA